MPIRNRRTIATDRDDMVVQITDDGSRTLIRTDTDDAYHSASGALTETRHVYLHNSGIAHRLANQKSACVLEVGLGTGMALLATLDQAINSDSLLNYTAIEVEWLTADVIRQLEPHRWVDNTGVVDRYLQYRQQLPTQVADGSYRWTVDAQRTVTIEIGDARNYSYADGESLDAVYFDPFAPASNAGLWHDVVFRQMHSLLVPGGRLVTYCVNRAVREVISAAGFTIEKVPGPPGGKREVLIATKRRDG